MATELIDALAVSAYENVKKVMNESNFVSDLADKTTDITCHKKLIIIYYIICSSTEVVDS